MISLYLFRFFKAMNIHKSIEAMTWGQAVLNYKKEVALCHMIRNSHFNVFKRKEENMNERKNRFP